MTPPRPTRPNASPTRSQSCGKVEPAARDGGLYAIIPAAGYSRRFGACKQLHPVNGRTLLECVLDAVASAGANRIILVTRTAVWSSLAPAWQDRLTVVLNDQSSSAMIDSVRMGLVTLRLETTVTGRDSILVCPGDMPRITAHDVTRTLHAHRAARDCIVLASHGGRRGHPLVFGRQWLPFVESGACDQGLNALAREHPDQVRTVACATDSVVHDVDTSDDLDQA